MEIIHIKESPKGTFSCPLDISAKEWEALLQDKSVTTQNYKDAILSFYGEPEHKATCAELAKKYYGNTKDASKYVSWITNFGKAVIKKLQRFRIVDSEGQEHFWHVAMCPGKTLPNNLFEWTLRPELAKAIGRLGWDGRFSWIPFYEEIADKLLAFKDDRKALLDIVYGLDNKHVKYISGKEEVRIHDVDPFTVIGIFNRGLTSQNRIDIADYFKNALGIKAALPNDFDGIPVVSLVKANFFYRDKVDEDIQTLWDVFEAALARDKSRLAASMNEALSHHGVKWNLSMGLYWIRPNDYIALDETNRNYLPKIGINVFKDKDLNAENYLALLANVKQAIAQRTLKEASIPDISYNAWFSRYQTPDNAVINQTFDPKEDIMPDSKLKEYISLIQENHNLVLTGAPGTGKTFLAKQIAKAMGADETTKNFVQFHPSYDYTDFVEGLRPSKEGDGFERRDGVFKAFCKVALQNYIDSDKSTEILEIEKDVAEAIDEFANDAIENSTILKTAGGKEFSIIDINDRHCTISIPSNPKVNMLKLRLKELKAILESDSKIDSPTDVQKILSQKWKTQDDTYLFILYQRIKPHLKKVQHVAKIEKKNFVFIIDEINRGDLSKIFGELFFSIDPGYRGTKGIVQTQYQNIVDEDDEYAEGFYIPKNVYIIATMNDIDRSVESMDFAMRRRFTWVEVTPDDRVEMLDNLPDKNEAVRRMKSLNAVIAATEGLGPAFQIGPAYFLKLKNGDFNRLWDLNIEPLLKEYLRGFRKSGETLKEFKKAYNSVED